MHSQFEISGIKLELILKIHFRFLRQPVSHMGSLYVTKAARTP